MGDPVEIEVGRGRGSRSEVEAGLPQERPTGRERPQSGSVMIGLGGLALLVIVVGAVLAVLSDDDAGTARPSSGAVVTSVPDPSVVPAEPWTAPTLSDPSGADDPEHVPAGAAGGDVVDRDAVVDDAVDDHAAADDASADAPAPVRTRELGRPLGLVATSTVVVGLAVGGDLVEIDLDLGSIRRTRLPDPVPDRADVQVIATTGATVIAGSVASLDARVVYVVPLGEPARPAGGALTDPWTRLDPGPSADTVWAIDGDGAEERRRLVDVLTGETIDATPGSTDAGAPSSTTDGNGTGAGGSRRIGPTGTTAVVTTPVSDGISYALVDLVTDEAVMLVPSHRPGQGISEEASIEWSSDGRLVLFLDGLRLVQHDTVTGTRALVGGFGDLMEIRRFTVRPAG